GRRKLPLYAGLQDRDELLDEIRRRAGLDTQDDAAEIDVPAAPVAGEAPPLAAERQQRPAEQ
ncbi:MAG TPA: hypothetical protein VFX76_10450, partial [Roseiflexaceae bacterium]|nr:hypothetical protein [Roseiflexaceae bacterium]